MSNCNAKAKSCSKLGINLFFIILVNILYFGTPASSALMDYKKGGCDGENIIFCSFEWWQNTDEDSILEALKSNQNLNETGSADGTPLHLAVRLGTIKHVSYLLSQGLDANALDFQGFSPLHLATIDNPNSFNVQQSFEKTKLLLDAGADLEKYTEGQLPDKTPFFYAALSGNIKVMRLLKDSYGANVDAKAFYSFAPLDSKITPLVYIANKATPETIKTLLELGADVSAFFENSTELSLVESRNPAAYSVISSAMIKLLSDAHTALVSEDYSKALSSFKQLSSKGSFEAQFYLGYMYYEGLGTPKDGSLAMELIKKSAEQDHLKAQELLAYIYGKGEIVDQNYGLSAEWYQKAADQNSTSAQSNLGSLYWSGLGVEKNLTMGTKLIRQAAEAGDISAGGRLAYAYAMGHGVVGNKTEALKWAKKSLEQGDLKSISTVSLIVAMTDHDPVRHYVWLKLQEHYPSTPDEVRKATKEAAANLNSNQLNIAQAKIQKCLGSNFQDCEWEKRPSLRESFNSDFNIFRKQLQYRLRQVGYYKGSIDGQWGPQTEQAIVKFADDNGWELYFLEDVSSILNEKVDLPKELTVSNEQLIDLIVARNASKNAPIAKTDETKVVSKKSGGFLKLLLLGGACAATPNPAACLAGASGGDTAYGSTGPNSSNVVISSPSSAGGQCSYDGQCGYREQCVKRLGKGICVKLVDANGRTIKDRNAEIAQCRRNSDCPRKFECNTSLRICVSK